MSAFLCSDLHTAAVALYITQVVETDKPASKLLSELRTLNNAALEHRYGDKPVRIHSIKKALAEAEAYMKTLPLNMLASHMLAMTDCLTYQCSEGKVLDEHKFAKFFADSYEVIQAKAKGVSRKGVWSVG